MIRPDLSKVQHGKIFNIFNKIPKIVINLNYVTLVYPNHAFSLFINMYYSLGNLVTQKCIVGLPELLDGDLMNGRYIIWTCHIRYNIKKKVNLLKKKIISTFLWCPRSRFRLTRFRVIRLDVTP